MFVLTRAKLFCRHSKNISGDSFSRGTCLNLTYSAPKHPVNLEFVPSCSTSTSESQDLKLEALDRFIDESNKLFVVTGAGISTESGIPDYRSEGVGLYAARNHKPMTHAEFMKSHGNRQRYWARSFIGWPGFSSREPNAAHHAVAKLESITKLHWLVTQNVDALHGKAGSKKITELHGDFIECQNCGQVKGRDDLQRLLADINPDWQVIHKEVDILPDGDVNLTQESINDFQIVSCENCNGVIKPKVVFFGDNVQRTIVESVFRKLEESDSVLVVGSSVQVYSAYRFIYSAWKNSKPIALLNIGPTRVDEIAQLKVMARCGDVLPKIKALRRYSDLGSW